MRQRRMCRTVWAMWLVLAAAPLSLSCDSFNPIGNVEDAFVNQLVPNRGAILVGFVNNSSARAIFTFGGYDQLNEETVPSFVQLRVPSGQSTTQISVPCRRLSSIGGVDLLRLIRQAAPNDVTDPEALVTGVNFSRAPADSPDATTPTEGTAAPLNLRNGVDYYCNGLVLFTFVDDPTAAGGHRIDFSFFPRE